MEQFITTQLEQIQAEIERIRGSGPVAPDGVTLSSYRPGGKSYQYFKLVASSRIFEPSLRQKKQGKTGKVRHRHVGKEGSEDYKRWQAAIKRRDDIAKLDAIARDLIARF